MNHKYLTERERYYIEIYLNEGYTPTQIAEKIGCCRATVYNEIKRGTVEYMDSLLAVKKRYDAFSGQRVMTENGHNKGKALKIGNDYSFVRKVEELVKEKKFSPYACIQYMRKNCPDIQTRVCLTTLYNYIEKGLFLGLSRNSLPYHKKPRKTAQESPRVAQNNKRGESIENRPKALKKRDSFGHWEIDTVVSGQGKSKHCLLVLTERKTRFELIKRMENKKAESTIAVLDAMEKVIGSDSFRNIFRTITTDNGVEFLNGEGMEKSIFAGTRTKTYYCHPYRSSERGSNEKQNQIIRRWIAKGSDISAYTDEYIKSVQHWLNEYPRELFGGRSACDMVKKENIFPMLGKLAEL